MYLNKLETKEIQAHVVGAFMFKKYMLKKYRNASNIKFDIPDDWWVDDTDIFVSNGQPAYVKAFETRTYHCTSKENLIKGIRPVLSLNFLSGNVQEGDTLLIKNHLFTMVNYMYAVCNTVIGYDTHAEALNFLRTWYQDIQQVPIYKVINKKSHHIPIRGINIPRLSVIKTYSDNSTGFSYWTRDRFEEFSGHYVNSSGVYMTDDILSKKNICPEIIFDNSEIELFDNDLFEINERLFKIVNAKRRIALCMNSVGLTCFSTAICEMGGQKEEYSYYKNSEAFEVLDNWYFKSYQKHL